MSKKTPITKWIGWGLIGYALYKMMQKPAPPAGSNNNNTGGGGSAPAEPGEPTPPGGLVLTQQPVKEKAI